jgi:hypothetical protein
MPVFRSLVPAKRGIKQHCRLLTWCIVRHGSRALQDTVLEVDSLIERTASASGELSACWAPSSADRVLPGGREYLLSIYSEAAKAASGSKRSAGGTVPRKLCFLVMLVSCCLRSTCRRELPMENGSGKIDQI